MLPHLPQLDGTDSHLYFGWYHGEERDLPGFAAAWPRMVRFVSEFGAQAVPDRRRVHGARALARPRLGAPARRHGLQRGCSTSGCRPPPTPRSTAWQEATQRYQAQLLRHHIETLRRLKYRPTGGFCLFCLADPPAVTWSVLGHERAAEAAYHVVVDACRPVIVVADRLPAGAVPGEALALDVHVVSDLRVPIEERGHLGRAVVARRRPGLALGRRRPGRHLRSGRHHQVVVPDAPGALVLDLDMVGGEDAATNRYETRITRP